MSYCRWGTNGSSVYVYEHCNGGWECCGCGRFSTREKMIEHLLWHRGKGDTVPDSVLEVLREEIRQESGSEGYKMTPGYLRLRAYELKECLDSLKLPYEDVKPIWTAYAVMHRAADQGVPVDDLAVEDVRYPAEGPKQPC